MKIIRTKSGHSKDIRYNKKRKKNAAGLLFILFLAGSIMNRSPDDIIYSMTAFILPELTYESEYGVSDRDYDASYGTPAWFYEDESVPENGDLATLDNSVDNGSQEESDDNLDKVKKKDEAVPLAVISNTSKGTSYTRKQLSKPGFLTSKIFTVDSNTNMTQEELDISNLMDTDLSISDLLQVEDISGTGFNVDEMPYKVLIYHTHASESFADSRPGVAEGTVVGVGAYLTKLLNEKYGIHTYHDETTYDVIDGQLDRSKAYENSYNGIRKILEENPSIEVVIDLHRDGVDEETHLVTEVNGKPTAKIMFLNGVSRSNLNGEIDYLQNPNKLMNLAFSFQLYLAGKEDYGDFVRKIYVRSLRYNLHVMPRATLIEAGAQNNTIEEELNAMEPLAAMLDKVLRKKE